MLKVFTGSLAVSLYAMSSTTYGEGQTSQLTQLLNSAQMWQAKARDDLALDALMKANLLSTSNPVILARLGEIYIELNKPNEAQGILQELLKNHPQSTYTRELEDVYRFNSQDRLALSTLEFQSRQASEDKSHIITDLKKLFPRGAPTGPMGLRYYRILSKIPGYEIVAMSGFQKLAKESPSDPMPKLEMANMLISESDTLIRGVKEVAALSVRDDIKPVELLRVWSRGLSKLERTPSTEPLFQQFIKKFPKETVPQLILTKEQLIERDQKLKNQRAKMLFAQAEQALKKRDFPLAYRCLQEAIKLDPKDTEYQLKLASLYLKDGKLLNALNLYDKVLLKDQSSNRAAAGKIESLAALGKTKAALDYARLYKTKYPKSSAIDYVYISVVRQEAKRLINVNQLETAQGVVSMAFQKIPESPWLRYELAALYALRGDKERGKSLFQAKSRDIEYISAKALFLRNIGDTQSALDAYAAIPESKRSISTRLAIADLYAAIGEHAKSEAAYKSILAAEAGNAEAQVGLLDSYLESGRLEEATRMLQTLTASGSVAKDKLTQRKTNLYRQKAEELEKQGKTAELETHLMSSIKELPDSGWLRHDLASHYLAQGKQQEAMAVFNQAPDNVETNYAKSIILSRTGEDEQVLKLMEAIPENQRSEAMNNLKGKAKLRMDIAQSLDEYRNGHTAPAMEKLRHLEAESVQNDDLAWECVEAWAMMGEFSHADQLAKRIISKNQDPRNSQLTYLNYLLHHDRFDEFTAYLAQVEASNSLTQAQKAEMNAMRARGAISQAWILRRSPHPEKAVEVLQSALNKTPDNINLQLTLADILYLADKYDEAYVMYEKALKGEPRNFKAKIGKAQCLYELGDKEQALSILEQLEKATPGHLVQERSVLAYELSKHDYEKSRSIVDQLLLANQYNGDALLKAASIEKSQQNYAEALNFLNKAISATNNDKTLSESDKESIFEAKLDSIELQRRQYGYYSSGFDIRQLSGTSGISEIINIDIPHLIRYPVGYEGHVFVQTDLVYLTAGNLHLNNFDDAADFGKINALCLPSSSGNTGPVCDSSVVAGFDKSRSQGIVRTLPATENQYAFGGPLAIGYTNDNWRLDIGTTPLGFPVSSIVGGAYYSGSWDKLYYSVEFARRPVSNSLLAYSGVHDPVTGETWGGVRSNGLNFYAGRDIATEEFGSFGFFTQGGAHYLEGQNVKSNADLMLRTGADWTFINREDMRLSIGLAGMYWGFANNQRHYTFGYGGYWSPQTYLSIGPPIFWTGRWNDLSYLLRGYVNYSYASENGGPLYPLNPELQYSDYNNNASFSASTGTALSFGVSGNVEYQLLPDLFIGAHFMFAQSPFYTPNYGGAYFRYSFAPRTESIPYPPEPLLPYYRF